jgi:hypothetical protein
MERNSELASCMVIKSRCLEGINKNKEAAEYLKQAILIWYEILNPFFF